MTAATNIIPPEQLKEHNERNSVWMSIHGNVVDVTNFLEQHPGGAEVLIDHAGLDASIAFDDIGHSEHAKELLEQFRVGKIGSTEQSCCKNENNKPKDTCLSEYKNWFPVIIGGALVAVLLAYHYNRS